MSLFQSLSGFLSSAIGSTEQLVSQHTGFSSNKNNADAFDYSPLTFFKDQNASSQKLENTHSENKFFSGTQVISSPFQTLKEASSLLPSKLTPVVEVFQTAISSAQSSINTHSSSSLTSSPASSATKFSSRREETNKFNSFAQSTTDPGPPKNQQSSPAMGMDVDLSHLSEEERLQIEAVMARAMGVETTLPPNQNNSDAYLPQASDTSLGQFNSYQAYERPFDGSLYQQDFVRDQEHLNTFANDGMAIGNKRDEDFNAYNSSGFRQYDDYLKRIEYQNEIQSANQSMDQSEARYRGIVEEKVDEASETGRIMSPDEDDVEQFECVICSLMKIKDQDDAICSDCRRANICFECGTSDNQEGVWLCNVCRKRRDLMNATTKWRQQQQEDEMSTSVFASRSTSSSTKMFEQPPDFTTLQQQHSLPSGSNRHAELQRQTSLHISGSYADLPSSTTIAMPIITTTPPTTTATSANRSCLSGMVEEKASTFGTNFDQYPSCNSSAQSDSYILTPLQPASHESFSVPYSSIYSESQPTMREQFVFTEKGRRLSDPVSFQSQVEGMSRNLLPSTQVLDTSMSVSLKSFQSEETRSYDGGPYDLGINDETFRTNQAAYQIASHAPPPPPPLPISLSSSSTSSSSVANAVPTSHQFSFYPDKKEVHESIVCASNQRPQDIQAIVSSHSRHDQDMPLASTIGASIFSKSDVAATAKSVKVPPIEKVGYADPELLQSPKRSPKSLSANFTSSNASWSRHRDSSPVYRDVGQYRPPAFNNNLPSNDRAPLQMLIKTSALPWTNNFNNSISSMAGSCDYEICVDSYNLSGNYFSGLMEAQNHFIFNTPPSISQMKDDAKIFLPPQKPARFSSSDPQRFEQAEGDTLASFAASIASDTALLTNTMSVSPMIEVKRGPEIIGPTSQLFAEFSRKTEDYLVNNQPFRNDDPSSAVENQMLSQYDHVKHLKNSSTSEVQSKNVGLAGKSIFSSNHKPISRHGASPTYPPMAIQGRIPINSQSDQERLKQSIMKRAPRYENLSKITVDSSHSAQPKTTDIVVGSSSAMEHVRRAGVCKPPDSTTSLMDLRSSVTSSVQSNLVEENQSSKEVLLANFTTSHSDERNDKSKASCAFAETASSSIVMMTPITSVNIFLSNFMKEDSDKDKQASTSQTTSSSSVDTIQRQSNEPIDLSICSNTNFSSKSSSSEQNSRVINSTSTPQDIITIQSTPQFPNLSMDSVPVRSSSKDNHENFDLPPTTHKYALEGNMNHQTGIASTKSESRAIMKSNSSLSTAQNSPQDLSNSQSATKKAQKRLPAIPMETRSSEPSHNSQVTFDVEKKQKDNAFEADSNLVGQTDLSDIDSKKTLSMVLMSISGQVSAMGKHEKTHRKLPPTPDQLPVSKTRLRSKSADSRKQQEESVETVKERLRRHLRTKEIHKRGGSSSEKSEDEEDSSDASNASSRFFTTGSASFRQRSTSFGANFGMSKERSSLRTPATSRAKSVGRQSRLDVFVNSKATSTHERFNNRADPDNQNKYTSNTSTNKFKTSRSLAPNVTNVNSFAKYKPQVEMVAFHGIQVPIEIKSLKQRIREELQIVTASRRLRLDEEEEVRRMEAEMAEREKKRTEWRPTYEKRYRSNSPVIHISKESYDHEPARSVSNKNDIINKYHKKHQSQNSKKSFIPINNKRSRQESTPSKHNKNYLYSSKPHSFKRQNSDPLISNLVTDTMSSGKTSYSERQHGRNYLDYEGIDRKLSDRHYDVQRMQGRKYMPKGYTGRSGYAMDATPQGYGSLSRSSDLLFKHVKPSLANSHSEANLLREGWSGEAELEERDTFHRRFLRTPSFSHMEENENPLLREEKKEQLRLEIELRKLQLEEARYLQEQIQRLMAMPDVTSTDISRARSLYQKRRRLDSQIFPFRSSEPGFIPNSEADNYQQKNYSVKDTNRSSTFSGLAFPSNQNVTDFSKITSIGKESFQRSASPESDENLIEVGSHSQPIKINGVVRKQTRQYSFPTKTILITRDLKDKYLEGFGIGVKITGGQFLDREGQMGAFVTTIYKGGAADQLHGELREGDQVLEWNGHPLTGKSQEEIDRIMSYSNGEIELVIRANESSISSKPSSIRSTLHTDSETSFLGNDNQSDRTFTDREIRKQKSKPYCSPQLSPTSSQQDLFSESSVLSSANSSKSDAGSPNECYNLPNTESYDYHNEKTVSRSKNDKHLRNLDGYNSRNKLEATHGEIQLQLSYDTYDSTLNVHVIQAKGLQTLDSRNQLDSFVKVQLIPLTNQAHKRCTKYISRNLNPEWHQTLVFMGVPRIEISQKSLEISVWDFDKFKNHQFLGEVLISLSDSRCLDNRPHWYQLQRSKKKHAEEEIKFAEENEDGGDSKRGHRRHDKDQKKGSEGGNLSRHRNFDGMKETTHKSRSGKHAKNAKTDCEKNIDSSDNTSQHDTGFGGDGSQDSLERSDKGNKEERITDNLRESLFSENSLVSLQSSMRSGKLKPARPQAPENRGIVNAQKTIFSKILSGIVSMMFKSFSCCQYTSWKDKHETIPMNRIEIKGSISSP